MPGRRQIAWVKMCRDINRSEEAALKLSAVQVDTLYELAACAA